FFDHFSRSHKGQPVTVESIDKESGAQVKVRNLPLLGIIVGATLRDGAEIEIMAGHSPEAFVAHVIVHPTKVSVADCNGCVSASVQIQSNDGTLTLVQAGPLEQIFQGAGIIDGIDRLLPNGPA